MHQQNVGIHAVFSIYDFFAGCPVPSIAIRRHHCTPSPLCQPTLARGHVHRRHNRRRDVASTISCTAINRPMVGHEDSEVPLHLQQGFAAIPQYLNALYRFTRPHTMLGTLISVTSVSALAVVSPPSLYLTDYPCLCPVE